MRVFACPNCGSWVEFEDRICLACDTHLSYAPDRDLIVRSVPGLKCRYRPLLSCNWVADPDPEADGSCAACRLTVERPDLEDEVAVTQLSIAEQGKRRLLRQLLHLGLPVEPRRDDRGLGFALKSPAAGEQVLTGHADGLITINLTEADDAHREALRISLGEPYRTMLGHMRHEIGHYYWQVLVDGAPSQAIFRSLFGDERQDYSASLDSHYGDEDGDGQESGEHITDYATMHPWEDFAETFAHYLHIADGLETTAAVGITVDGPTGVSAPLAGTLRSVGVLRLEDLTMAEILGHWHGFAIAANALSRSMGEPDLYPFVITPSVAEKLAYVHELVRAA
ncbi:putative zinc-binding metallopeptidase [Naasia sp. SYSU D00948]|uniref:zinc-binding metallopeptidase family protein n=1 Tax=Naasia sp. SYSU D00948 TaxID=2817379 RepID=UPI001B312904|nr:putative zinc-binding metallopeptidase [Naasia sp. SYSU D00948]